MSHNGLLIVDFGSQVTQLIARRIREAGVFASIAPHHKADEAIQTLRPRGIILSGGPDSVTRSEAPELPLSVLEAAVPIFAICYGQQALNVALGGKVTAGKQGGEFGRTSLHIKVDDEVLPKTWRQGQAQDVWMSHGDSISELAPGFDIIGTSEGAPYAMVVDKKRQYFAVQFHPEVAHTPDGDQLLRNFAINVCGCTCDWTMDSFKDRSIEQIRAQVGSSKVICGLSGGVDSSVTAVLIHKAIGDQLTCIFVDHGLLRQNEAEEVVRLFRDHYNIPLIHVDAADEFMSELEGVSDPETKRKIIGRKFIDVFDAEAQKIDNVAFLAQGTLYPDVIESVSATGGASEVIKSHHNVGGLPDHMALKLVEPLRSLFKDEVRILGRELGIPQSLLGRHPFPGPGLGIRIIGEFQRDKVAILQKADAIYIDEIKKAGLYDKIWQAFAVLLPVNTVGVMGDGRTYEQVCALRAVTSQDGMTADFYPFDMAFIARVASRIVNEVQGINRVVYDITSKPPGTIEWE